MSVEYRKSDQTHIVRIGDVDMEIKKNEDAIRVRIEGPVFGSISGIKTVVLLEMTKEQSATLGDILTVLAGTRPAMRTVAEIIACSA